MMNERIRLLAEQAFFDEATSQPSDKMYTFSDHKMQKFAELIVRECIKAIDDSTPVYSEEDCGDAYCQGTLNGYQSALLDVKEHFGVE